MGAETKIEWTDHTFNPWRGCARISPGCEHCYAEALAKRTGIHGTWGPKGERVVSSAAYWRQPLKWNRDAERDGVRRRVFCASMADVFEDRRDLEEPRERLFALIANTPHLDWLLLTKRPENIVERWPVERFAPPGAKHWPNVWLGTTVEDQERADERIPHLLAVPAAVRFLSVEPLLGPVDLRFHLGIAENHDDLRGGIGWVIVGGESGPGARPCDVAWIRDVVRQCREAGVPCFVKQLGALSIWPDDDAAAVVRRDVPAKWVCGRGDGTYVAKTHDPKGGDPAEWPEDLRVREFPARRAKA